MPVLLCRREALGDKTQALALARELEIPTMAATAEAVDLEGAQAFLTGLGESAEESVCGIGVRGGCRETCVCAELRGLSRKGGTGS